ncbi:hypothetical protein L873DRAFT_1345270 [Choiromyces venosus 120613-1]|uniref:Uncharacterized protein n=1 Tax=Choiromyces venosus 120613-1 TaxID=1336337 RepID=A0A3N4K566_9PEZI|nr:hypothetical protein L873DRAFT_1345270 [Choiromyces venosus 120613-1]
MNFTAIIAKFFLKKFHLSGICHIIFEKFYITTIQDGGHLKLVRSVAMYLSHTKALSWQVSWDYNTKNSLPLCSS